MQLVAMAAAAGFGSFFMWVVVGPFVLKRAGPKMFKDLSQELFNVTDDELKKADNDMMKAVANKQAQAVYGAIGNIVQTAPTAELENLAKQYGFEDVADAKQKLLGPGGGTGLGLNPAGLAALTNQLNGGGGKNSFSGVVDLIVAINAISQMGAGGFLGGGAPGAMPSMPALPAGGGYGGASGYSFKTVSGW